MEKEARKVGMGHCVGMAIQACCRWTSPYSQPAHGPQLAGAELGGGTSLVQDEAICFSEVAVLYPHSGSSYRMWLGLCPEQREDGISTPLEPREQAKSHLVQGGLCQGASKCIQPSSVASPLWSREQSPGHVDSMEKEMGF